jgi:hypothetical protein
VRQRIWLSPGPPKLTLWVNFLIFDHSRAAGIVDDCDGNAAHPHCSLPFYAFRHLGHGVVVVMRRLRSFSVSKDVLLIDVQGRHSQSGFFRHAEFVFICYQLSCLTGPFASITTRQERGAIHAE